MLATTTRTSGTWSITPVLVRLDRKIDRRGENIRLASH